MLMGLGAFAQQVINLPKPDLSGNPMTVGEALATRHSSRQFATTALSQQEISNLCWAACGMSRDDKHRTAPTAMNRQEIRLFVFNNEGVYEYNAKDNTLVKKADGDQRELLASGGSKPANGKPGFRQGFVVDAPVSLLMVIDFDLFGMDDEKAKMMGCVDAGNVSENINLYCQAAGLVTVPRATHDTDGIRKLLGFSEKQLPIMNNPVGYPVAEAEAADLNTLRTQLDAIDNSLINTLANRMKVSEQVAAFKAKRGMPAMQPARFEEVLKTRCEQGASKGLDTNFVKQIYETIHTESVRVQNNILAK